MGLHLADRINARVDWNLTCKIDKNTFKNTDAGKDE
jgi:hypothetical protein